jgi:hypothetical protein
VDDAHDLGVPVILAPNLFAAQRALDVLLGEGIEAVLHGPYAHSQELGHSPFEPTNVIVRRSQFERARGLLREVGLLAADGL